VHTATGADEVAPSLPAKPPRLLHAEARLRHFERPEMNQKFDRDRGQACEPAGRTAAGAIRYAKWMPSTMRIVPAEHARGQQREDEQQAFAGGSAASAGAAAALSQLQEIAHLPIFTTNSGKGSVDESHPLSCGVLGALTGPRSLGQRTRGILDEADVVLLVGTRANQNGTDSRRLVPPAAALNHIDIGPQAIGRNNQALRLVGDAATTLEVLHGALQTRDIDSRRARRPDLERRIAAASQAFDTDRAPLAEPNSAPIRPERIMRDLQDVLAPETTVVAGASYSSMSVVGRLRRLRAGMCFITSRGLAGFGWGLPLAIGAKLACPGARSSPSLVTRGAHSSAENRTDGS
jgi:acetolactate synthase I/II/III large subunit